MHSSVLMGSPMAPALRPLRSSAAGGGSDVDHPEVPRQALSARVLSICLLFAATLTPSAAWAQQEGDEVLRGVREALEKGDAEQLMEASGERIDLTVFGVSELLSRSQASYVVRAFFAEYPPSAVRLIDTSESDGNWFASAEYSYESGTVPLSVYLRLRRGSSGWELRELRFDRSTPR